MSSLNSVETEEKFLFFYLKILCHIMCCVESSSWNNKEEREWKKNNLKNKKKWEPGPRFIIYTAIKMRDEKELEFILYEKIKENNC
jgi:hypothetical protein